jgi:hypothetical protein
MKVAFVVLLAVGGCRTGAPYPHDLGHHNQACDHIDSSQRSTDRCTFDSDCGICHDGTDCGTIMSADKITARGSACQQLDAAQCELASARCCGGVCVVAGWGPD